VSRRGPNFARNERKRAASARKRGVSRVSRIRSQDWRAAPVVSGVVSQQGFFSGCEDVVQQELRDSRAKLYIAQNRLRAQKAEKDLQAMNSVQGIVQQMVDVSTAVAKLQKQSTDQAVQGWAKTVAASLSKSITESSSSVPSLESVGFGASGLRSTDGEVLDPGRVAAYERDLKYVNDSFDAMESYSEDDYKFAVDRVKAEFEDVAFSPAQRQLASFKREAATRFLALGFDFSKVQDCLLLEN
jgi:hypothetical protein